MKRTLFIFILLFNFVYAQCPDSIRPLNNNYDTFRVYWGNSKPNTNSNIQITIENQNTLKTFKKSLLKGDTLFLTNKVDTVENWDLIEVKYKNTKVNCNKPLPVELLYFKYKNNRLIWETASETNNRYFIIQVNRSNRWVDIDTVKSKYSGGTSLKNTKYEYSVRFDKEVYCRLKQVDFGGTYEYSNIVVINKNKISSIYKFYNLEGDMVYKGTKEEFCNKFNKYQLYFYKENKGFEKIVITDG